MTDLWRYLDPDSFRLDRPAVRSCPDCQCCTARLCETARARGSTCEAEAGDRAADAARCPCQPARPGSIFDRWADAATPEAFDVQVAPEPVPDGPVLEDHDDREARKR